MDGLKVIFFLENGLGKREESTGIGKKGLTQIAA
jgi:hypothetical protein